MPRVKLEKEIDQDALEIIDGLFDLYDDIAAGKEIAIISAENLPSLMKAVDNYKQGIDAAKGADRGVVIGHTCERAVNAFVPYEEKTEEQPAEQPAE